MTRLRTIVDAAVRATPAEEWVEAVERIREERMLVLAHLAAHPEEPAYGFTTLLGPLDGVEYSEEALAEVRRAHRVGTPRRESALFARVVTAVKLTQLAHSFTGVSAESYERLIDRLPVVGEIDIPLQASYGAGDVVPATWWADQVLGEARLPRGDFIALINGSFIAAAVAALAGARTQSALGRVVALLVRSAPVHPRLAREGGDRELLERLAPFAIESVRHRTQLPVSGRDAGPVVLGLHDPLVRLEAALESAVSSASGNPLFHRAEDGTGVVAVSQSSFLDFRLRTALDSVESSLSLAAGTMQRWMERQALRSAEESTSAASVLVQPPKVLEALRAQMEVPGGVLGFSGSMSGGVEDLWDGATAKALVILRKLDLLEQQLEIASAVLGDEVRQAEGTGAAGTFCGGFDLIDLVRPGS